MAFARSRSRHFQFEFAKVGGLFGKGHNFFTKSPTDKRSSAKRSWIFKLTFTEDRLSIDFFRKKLQPLAFGVAECQGGGRVLEGVTVPAFPTPV